MRPKGSGARYSVATNMTTIAPGDVLLTVMDDTERTVAAQVTAPTGRSLSLEATQRIGEAIVRELVR